MIRAFRVLICLFGVVVIAAMFAMLMSAADGCTPPSLATTGACPTPGEFRCHDLQLEACTGGSWTPVMPDICGRPGIVCCSSRSVAQAGIVLNCVAQDRCVP